MSSLTSAANDVRYLILGLQRKGNNQLGKALSVAEVSPSQAEVIGILARKGPLSLKELGRELVCETGDSPSRLVDRLVEKGLVSKARSPLDGRSLLLDLTNHGSRVNEDVIVPVEIALVSSITQSLSVAEMNELRRLLRKLATEVS